MCGNRKGDVWRGYKAMQGALIFIAGFVLGLASGLYWVFN